MGTQLNKSDKERIIAFLQKNIEAFVEYTNSAKGIDCNIIEHQLDVIQKAKPIKQKMRQLRSKRKETANKKFGN